MTRISFYVIYAFISLLIVSCNSSHDHVTDYTLCKKLATLPSYNVHHSARKQEVRKRSLDCSKYASRIDDELSQEALARARAPKNYTTYKNPYDNLQTDDRLERLERAERNRDFQCIMDSGVPVGGRCM